ncbi:CDP-glycerol--poly(glycerophosphate) glycerophosphotransferase [Jonesia denitrificans]|uniref:CDP-glycerol:poly(Glycerophosphate) glycerophosphotransferase n=1 Tax=Jonesia denitrificans (strain ATCC 14870 / DSM 20603 / BCRC 15368 / CIP 55.134 / JCM 11481 / NBRC 15587 / NCTC 10816 / Prevot 55134) TaxID=471856 RepID=C7QZI8_JONDD|nr:CDP-glycerol--poly(glycerophosphate) glycerophosphotransferase [Jonesia denitrificans]ACV09486.1 CDP-glycerol:poly(glycerophosphate) glycerophosphotransferase [Jonesia denitrificans DSM 20603]ASE09276.1 CDP-glycerol--poly(glycerophosphate) glycerophosphotransferase [Jonesia denitrificans]QXB43818.1 CDP-glycerol--poly(glycerophosphate) glycerophosphotransferase [Jonesia denitrificans]SQH21858.1 CDP-Glycerol:Poly(glycerophosphate) glycerophosphotransferase [Jonesia denitrificans]
MSLADDEPLTWPPSHRRVVRFALRAGVRPHLLSLGGVITIGLVAWTPWWCALVASIAVGGAHIACWKPMLSRVSLARQQQFPAVWGTVLGTFVVPRIVLLGVGITAFVAAGRWELAAVVGLAFTLLLGLELSARALIDRALPVAAHLPGFPSPKPLPYAPSLAAVGWVGAVTGSVISALSSAPWWVPVVLFGCVAGVLIGITAVVGRLVYERGRRIGLLRDALVAYSPVFLFHWQAPENTTYQVEMWLPYLEALELPYALVARTPSNFAELSRITTRPVILRERISELDVVVTPSVRAVLYSNTATVNNHMVRYTDLTHIQLNHGDSDKAPSYNPAFKMFTRNFVAGPAAIERFSAHGISTPADFFAVVGRPQVTPLTVGPLPSDLPFRTVVYAPTWHGFYADTNYSSLPVGLALVRELVAAKYCVVFRSHPYSRRDAAYARMRSEICSFLEAERERSGLPHVFGVDAESPELYTVLNVADALVTDVSSVAADFLYTERPFAVVHMASPHVEDERAQGHVYSIDGHALMDGHLTAESALAEFLGAVAGEDPRASQRRDAKRFYLGDIPDDKRVSHFVETLRAEVQGAQ